MKPLTEEQKSIIDEYRETVLQMRLARNAFENATEPQLIESCVYEIKAIQSRTAYLLARLKSENLTGESEWSLR